MRAGDFAIEEKLEILAELYYNVINTKDKEWPVRRIERSAVVEDNETKLHRIAELAEKKFDMVVRSTIAAEKRLTLAFWQVGVALVTLVIVSVHLVITLF
jgi:hypothetical protein